MDRFLQKHKLLLKYSSAESLAGAMRKEKGIQIKKEEAKVYLQIIDWLKIY